MISNLERTMFSRGRRRTPVASVRIARAYPRKVGVRGEDPLAVDPRPKVHPFGSFNRSGGEVAVVDDHRLAAAEGVEAERPPMEASAAAAVPGGPRPR
jgi:hypothetical protein